MGSSLGLGNGAVGATGHRMEALRLDVLKLDSEGVQCTLSALLSAH